MDFLLANTSLTTNLIGEIDIGSSSAYVEVPMERVDEIYELLSENGRRRKKTNRARTDIQVRSSGGTYKKRKKE